MIVVWVFLAAFLGALAGAALVFRSIPRIVAALPDDERVRFAKKVMALAKVREV